MKLPLLAAAFAVALPVSAAPAFADDDMAPARLQRLDDEAVARKFPILHKRAIEIALQNGIKTVHDVDLEDDGDWQIEGRDADGRELEIELSATDGSIRKIDRD